MTKCLCEIIFLGEDRNLKISVALQTDATGKDLLEELARKARIALVDYELVKILTYNTDFNEYEDFLDGLDALQPEDKGRYQLHLSKKFEGLKEEDISEIFYVPRRHQTVTDDEIRSLVSGISSKSYSYVRDSQEIPQVQRYDDSSISTSNIRLPQLISQQLAEAMKLNPEHLAQEASEEEKTFIVKPVLQRDEDLTHVNLPTAPIESPPPPAPHPLHKNDDTSSTLTLASNHSSQSIRSTIEVAPPSSDVIPDDATPTQDHPSHTTAYYDFGPQNSTSAMAFSIDPASIQAIERLSLGCHSVPGGLFDAYRDKYLDVNMFGDNIRKIPKDSIKRIQLEDSKMRVVERNNFRDVLNYLDMKSEQTMSTIAKLNVVKGHGQYLVSEAKSEREISTSFLYLSKHERLEMNLEKIHHLVVPNVIFNNPNVTHFVSGIDYGRILIIRLRAKLVRDVNEETIVDQMQKYLQEVKELLKGNKEPEVPYKFSCQIYCDDDYRLPKMPRGPKSTIQLASLIQSMLEQAHQVNSRGTTIGYKLTPVHALKVYNPSLNISEVAFHPLAVDLFEEILKRHEAMVKSLAMLNDLGSDVKEFSMLLNETDVKSFEKTLNEVVKNHNVLRKELGVLVVAMRRKEDCDYTWEAISDKFDKLVKRIDALIHEDWKPFIAKVHYYHFWKTFENFTYVGKDGRLEDTIKELPEVHALFSTWKNVDTTPEGELAKFEELLSAKKPCWFVDQDVTAGKFPNESRICVYQNGKIVDEDLLGRYVKKLTVCVAVSKAKAGVEKRPEDAVQLEICCPKSLEEEGCEPKPNFWYCKDCYECYYYFNEFFYCKCGQASAFSFEFRCNDPAHGGEFHAYKERSDMEKVIKDIKPMQDMNIVLLSMSGVGKSTMINGIANYMSFLTLGQALSAPKPVYLIPTKYMIKGTKVQVGEENATERLKVGASATTEALGHVFVTRNLRIHFIDTPGIGDTDGTGQDQKNIGSILSYLSAYKEIHAVMILMRANETRANIFFKYCINELLVNLHKDAAKNIIFCFTAAKANYFTGGESLPILQNHLNSTLSQDEDMSDVKVEIKDENTFYLDNEAIRYLYARKIENVKFTEKEIEGNTTSWNHSQKEIARMIKYIQGLKPHRMQDMLSLNEARRLILLLAKPLADITRIIATNTTALNEKIDHLNLLGGNEQDLKQRLAIPQFDIETEQLGYPRTVCTAAKCIRTQTVGSSNVVQNLYVMHCHPKCSLSGVVPDRWPDERLRGCWAMNGSSDCRVCGCPYSVHMHITYEQKLVQKFVTDPSMEAILSKKSNDRADIEATIRIIERTIKEYDDEKKAIADICCIFASFLKNYSIMPYNDAFEDYVKHNIQEEERVAEEENLSSDVQTSRRAKLEELKKTLSEYREQKDLILNSNSVTSYRRLNPDDIKKQTEKLFALPKTGNRIKEIFERASVGHEVNLKFAENKFEPSTDIERFNEAVKNPSDSLFSKHTMAPSKLPNSIKVDPPKKQDSGNTWGIWKLVDKFWYMVGGRENSVTDEEEFEEIGEEAGTENTDSHANTSQNSANFEQEHFVPLQQNFIGLQQPLLRQPLLRPNVYAPSMQHPRNIGQNFLRHQGNFTNHNQPSLYDNFPAALNLGTQPIQAPLLQPVFNQQGHIIGYTQVPHNLHYQN